MNSWLGAKKDLHHTCQCVTDNLKICHNDVTLLCMDPHKRYSKWLFHGRIGRNNISAVTSSTIRVLDT